MATTIVLDEAASCCDDLNRSRPIAQIVIITGLRQSSQSVSQYLDTARDWSARSGKLVVVACESSVVMRDVMPSVRTYIELIEVGVDIAYKIGSVGAAQRKSLAEFAGDFAILAGKLRFGVANAGGQTSPDESKTSEKSPDANRRIDSGIFGFGAAAAIYVWWAGMVADNGSAFVPELIATSFLAAATYFWLSNNVLLIGSNESRIASAAIDVAAGATAAHALIDIVMAMESLVN